MNNKKIGLIIGILVLVVLILGTIVVYTYIAKPAYTGYVTQTYNKGEIQGASDVLSIIVNEIQTQG